MHIHSMKREIVGDILMASWRHGVDFSKNIVALSSASLYSQNMKQGGKHPPSSLSNLVCKICLGNLLEKYLIKDESTFNYYYIVSMPLQLL